MQQALRRGERRRLSPLARVLLTLSLVGVFAGALAVFSPEAPAVKQPQILTTNAETATESVALATELSLTTAEEAAATEASAAATGATGTATLSALASTTAASSNAASTTAASSNAASTTAASSNAASTTAATATTGTMNGNGAATTGTTTGSTLLQATLLTSTAVVRPSFFSATRTKRTVSLRWRTESEAETLGFNIYRAQPTKRMRVNGRLIPARGGSGPHSYTYRHRLPKRLSGTLRYWLQIVHTDGSRSWFGPVVARV